MTALFALLLIDAAARYVMSRNQALGWWISLAVCPLWALSALLSDFRPAAFLALPWAVSAILNLRRTRPARPAVEPPTGTV